MRRSPAANQLFELMNEAIDYLPANFYSDNADPPSLGNLEVFREQVATPYRLGNRTLELFQNLQSIQITQSRSGQQARSPLILRALSVVEVYGAKLEAFNGSVDAFACYGSELRFERSLAWLETGEAPMSAHRPAVVLYDVEDRPCAFQKASGLPTAYVWRDCVMPTEEGEQWVPAGMIVAPRYTTDPNEDLGPGPQVDHPGKGLISLRDEIPIKVELLRPSTAYLPGALRRSYLKVGVLETYKLAVNLSATCRLTDKSVGKRVGRLLRQNPDIAVF